MLCQFGDGNHCRWSDSSLKRRTVPCSWNAELVPAERRCRARGVAGRAKFEGRADSARVAPEMTVKLVSEAGTKMAGQVSLLAVDTLSTKLENKLAQLTSLTQSC